MRSLGPGMGAIIIIIIIIITQHHHHHPYIQGPDLTVTGTVGYAWPRRYFMQNFEKLRGVITCG